MIEQKPWFCPSCQKYHGPHVDTCPAGPAQSQPLGRIATASACPMCGLQLNGLTGYACPALNCPLKGV